MDFGLGLVLSFTDNATAGINNAVNSLNTLSQTAGNALSSLDQMASLRSLSVIADQIGNSFLGAGNKILSTFSNVIQGLNQTGSTLMYAEMQFDKLYNRIGAGKEVLKNIQDYAKRSIFEFEDLIPSVVMLKANGIEAFDTIGKSIDGADRNLMDYAADLAAFNPQMRNMYGTGIQAAMGALNEYIAEGNAKSLKSGASLDITGILGEDKGKTIEERTDQIVRLMEKLNMVGMVSSMEGRPEQMLSNIGDVLFDLKGRIANSGVYEEFSKLIGIVANFVFSLTDGELQSLAETVSSALVSIMKPVEKLATKVVELATSLKDLLIQNPKLAKFATITVAIGGALSVLAGVFLKFTSAMSGVSLFMLTFGKSFASLGSLIKIGSLKILSTLIPLTMSLGLLALSWKTDFAGIRTNVTYFFNGIINSFKTAKEAVSGSVDDMIKTLESLRAKDDFFSNLTIGIMKVMVFLRALADGWNDYSLSEDNFLKAKELGILPLIEAILDLKYRFGFFKQGFIAGWKEIGEKVRIAVMGFLDNIKGTFLEDMINNLTEFLQKLASGDTQAWYDFGKSFADFTAKAVSLWVALKAINSVIGGIVKVYTILSGIGKSFSVFGKIGGWISKAFPHIAGLTKGFGDFLLMMKMGLADGLGFFKSLEIALTTVATPLAGIISLVSGIALAVTGFVKQLTEGFSWFWEIVKWIGIALAAVGAVILGIASGPIAAIVAAVVGAVTTIIVLVKQYWNEICSFFGTIAQWIYANVIQPILNFFTTYIYPFIEKIVEIVAKIIEIIFALVNVAVQWIYSNVIVPIGQFFSELWSGIVGGVSSFIEGVKAVLTTIVEWISTNVITPVANLFQGLWEKIQTAFQTVADTVSSVFKGVVNTVFSFIGNMINNVIKGINSAIGVINAIPGVKITKITELSIPQLAQGGVVDKPTTALIGEAGTEAVVPLENNTGWISNLATMLTSEIAEIVPSRTPISTTTNQSNTSNRYMTSNSNTTQNISGDTDNSVTFNSGSIQIVANNSSDEEAERLGKKIMEYIKRQQELSSMTNYA